NFIIDPMPATVTSTDDGPAVGVAPALVQTARSRGILAGVVAADAALRQGLTQRDDLATEVASVAGWPGASAAGAMLRFADACAESPGESVVRVVCSVAGIDLVPRFEVCGEDGQVLARRDFKVRGCPVGLEFDGRVKYQDAEVP